MQAFNIKILIFKVVVFFNILKLKKKKLNILMRGSCVFPQSLLIVLRESHRTRTVFRKVGGFVYVMSVLVSMEGCLADPPKQPWDQGALFIL